MRADAAKNYSRLLEVAREVVAEQGVDASLRDIARRADVGFATLLRHFPTRDALLEALLRAGFDDLAVRASSADPEQDPGSALAGWLRDFVACAATYRGVVELMTSALDDPESALHDSCAAMKTAGSELLARAQAAGAARTDLDGIGLFGLAGAAAWIHSQPALVAHADPLGALITDVIFDGPAKAT
ncbi:TetR/AcrR family transcriptional regulator [Clavibacter sp. km1a]|uniref:TetR/AcrR family transcriptional regulator n=1 Tax=Clavibacter sp. km1a TaxID=3459136 RepID=UPI004042C3A5